MGVALSAGEFALLPHGLRSRLSLVFRGLFGGLLFAAAGGGRNQFGGPSPLT